MSKHIDFIEKTYDVVRTPLNYIKNKIEYIMSNNNNMTTELPQIGDA